MSANQQPTNGTNSNQLVIEQLTVEVKAIKIGRKQMTMGLFRQLPKKSILDRETYEILGNPWCSVNYYWGDCIDDHLHIVWQQGDKIYRDCLYKPEPYRASTNPPEGGIEGRLRKACLLAEYAVNGFHCDRNRTYEERIPQSESAVFYFESEWGLVSFSDPRRDVWQKLAHREPEKAVIWCFDTLLAYKNAVEFLSNREVIRSKGVAFGKAAICYIGGIDEDFILEIDNVPAIDLHAIYARLDAVVKERKEREEAGKRLCDKEMELYNKATKDLQQFYIAV